MQHQPSASPIKGSIHNSKLFQETFAEIAREVSPKAAEAFFDIAPLVTGTGARMDLSYAFHDWLLALQAHKMDEAAEARAKVIQAIQDEYTLVVVEAEAILTGGAS